jgi:hypothetical protein
LREKVIENAEGYYQTLGEDDAKWYEYDSTKCVESEPPVGAANPAEFERLFTDLAEGSSEVIIV